MGAARRPAGHLPDLIQGDPFGVAGLPRLEHNVRLRRWAAEEVEVKKASSPRSDSSSRKASSRARIPVSSYSSRAMAWRLDSPAQAEPPEFSQVLGKGFFSVARLVRSRCPAPSHTQTQPPAHTLQASLPLLAAAPTGAATGGIYIHSSSIRPLPPYMLDHMVPYLRPIDNRFPIERIEMTKHIGQGPPLRSHMIALKT